MYLLVKEIKNLLRQQRTWWLTGITFLIPFIGFFLLFRFTGLVISSQIDNMSKGSYKVAWIGEKGQAELLRKKLAINSRITLVDSIKESELQSELEKDSIALGIVIDSDFDSALVQGRKAKITLHYLQQGGGGAVSITERMIADIEDNTIRRNLDSLGVPTAILSPIQVTERNYFNMQRMIDVQFKRLQGVVSGLLALLLLIFAAIGGRYALRRVFFEEEQAGQLFQLRATAIAPLQLFNFKSLSVALFAWVSMVFSVLGFAAALSFDQEGLMQNILVQFRDLATWGNLLLLIFSALPFALLLTQFWAFWGFLGKGIWAGVLSNIFLLLLVGTFMFSMLLVPDLNAFTASIPFLNYLFLCFGILTATYTVVNLLIVCGVTMLLAILFGGLSFGLWRNK